MEVYATQPSSEVLKCQQHVVVVPNLRLHPRLHQHQHHLQLPKLQIGTQSISAPASPSCAVVAAAALTPPAFATSSAPSVEMKRSYEQSKTSKTSHKEPASSSSSKAKCSVVVPSSVKAKSSSASLPLVSPCHKDKMAAAARASAAVGLKIQAPVPAKANGAGHNNNGETSAIKPAPAPSEPPPKPKAECDGDDPRADVFLGGSCNPTTWRTDRAIPLLKKLGISYYNPQVAHWCPELISLEHEAKTHAKCLLFVIDSQTRSVVGLIEVAFLAAQGRRVVLVLPTHERQAGQSIMGEEISQSESEELSSAHLLLKKLVERHQIDVFNDLDDAIHCIAKILKEDGISTAETLDNNLKNAFDSLSDESGDMNYSQLSRAYRLVSKSELGTATVRGALHRFSQHAPVIRSQSSSSGIGTASSGDDSPPLKKDLVGEERFKPVTKAMNGDRKDDRINFEEFKYLMNELMDTAEQQQDESATPSTRFLQRMKDVLDRLLDDLTDQDRLRSYDVYLRGAGAGCGVDTKDNWMTEKAIPLLQKHNLTHCSTDYVTTETPSTSTAFVCPADDCRVLFIYLNDSSRAVELMTLASYYIGLNRHQLVFCIQELQDDCQSGDEKLTKIAIKDYNRGRSYIADIAKRNEFSVYSDMDEALQKVVELCNRF